MSDLKEHLARIKKPYYDRVVSGEHKVALGTHDDGIDQKILIRRMSDLNGLTYKQNLIIFKELKRVIKGALNQGSSVYMKPFGAFVAEQRNIGFDKIGVKFISCNWFNDWVFNGSGYRHYTVVDDDGNEIEVVKYIYKPYELVRNLYRTSRDQINYKCYKLKPEDYDDWQKQRAANNRSSSRTD